MLPIGAMKPMLQGFLELKSSWAAKDYILGMRNYSGVKAMQIIEKIREVDAKVKGIDDNTNTSADELMKELLFFILH